MDTFMQTFRKRPFRCRSCRKRFYGTEDEVELLEESDVEAPVDQEAG
jgi:hypothetical protein